METYQQGTWVYFDIHYADPGNDVQGFGFIGVNGSSWVAETYPFDSPGPGVAGPDSIAYPLDLECGTAGQHTAEVQAWIYDAAGARSQPVMIQLACDPAMPPGRSSQLPASRHMHLRVRPLLLPCLIWQQGVITDVGADLAW